MKALLYTYKRINEKLCQWEKFIWKKDDRKWWRERETKRREMNAKEWMERRHGAWEFVWDIKRETQPKKESIMSI